MFNRKEQEYELRMQHLKESMDKLAEKNKGMEKDLEKARARISELEEKLAQSELETLKREAQETLAEYKGLKELYLRKNQEFDGSMQTKEENYAKEEVHARRQFNDEIAQQKQDTEEYVSETVNTFSETYNYYLNQIKVLMDALGKVASATGKQLFSGEAVDLKTEFARFILANSITLTPGTITVLSEGNTLTVHCLRRELLGDLSESVFVRLLRKMEA